MTSKRFPFTKRSIEAIPAHDPDSPSREAEYSDAECIGLKLRVSKGGRKFFQHRYRYMGRKKCLSLGEYPHVSVQDARLKVSEHKSLLARDIDPGDERSRKTNDLTFKKFAEEIYLVHAMQAKRSWIEDKYKLQRQIIPAFGDYRLSTITTRDVSMFLTQQKERTSSTTANHYATLIKRMCNLAVTWGYIEKNPAANIEKYREPPNRERILSREELPRFLKALDQQEDRLSVAALRLLLLTGCRKNEVLSLKWDQVRLDEGRLFLPITKNGQSRSVLLNSKAKGVLEVLLAQREEDHRTRESEYLFPSRNGTRKGHIHDLRKPFLKVCEAANIVGMRIHDLRHTAASWAIMGGSSLFEVQKMLGHSDISTTQRYTHLADEKLQKAADNLANMIDQASNN